MIRTVFDELARLELPGGWEDQTIYHFRCLVGNEVEVILELVLDRHIQHTVIERFARVKTEAIETALQGIEILRDEETTVDGGNPAYEFVFKWIPAEGMRIYRKYVFVLKDGIGYAFSCEMGKKTFKMIGTQLKDVIETLVPGTYTPIES